MSNTAKFLAVRIGGIEPVVLEDEESTFAELQDRIKRTVSILESVEPEKMNANQDKPYVMVIPSTSFKFESGQAYVSEFAIPNFHFHMSGA